MKKMLLAVSGIISLSMSAHAQIAKKSVLLGGDLGFATQKTDESIVTDDKRKLNSFFISPTIGIAIKENLVVGGSINYRTQTDKSEALDYRNKYDGYGAGVFVRRYKPIGKSGFYVFGQAGLGVQQTKQEIKDLGTSVIERNTITSIAANAFPGISFAVSRKFHLESGFNNLITISYAGEKREQGTAGNMNTYKSSGFGLTTSLSNAQSAFYVGFRVLLAK